MIKKKLKKYINSPSPTPIPIGTPPPSPKPSPLTPIPTPTVITNINNNQVTVRNDGRCTVQNYEGAVTATPDCPPQSATVVLGPSPMQNGGARILAALSLHSNGWYGHTESTRRTGNTTCSSKYSRWTNNTISGCSYAENSPITQGQTLYTVNLSGQITGPDPATGNPVTLNGNINALFIRNNGEQDIELSADNSVALNAVLS